MDAIIYNNLFETKGQEYLIIIAFFIVLIFFWFVINKKTDVVIKINEAIGNLTARIQNIPQGLFYSRTHTWAFLEESGNARIGLNDFLATVIGNVKINMLKAPGESINKGEVLAEMYQGDKRLEIASPITGAIIKTNPTAIGNPNALFNDPYSKGWLCAVKPTQWKADTNSFLLANDASKWMLGEIDRFKDFLAVSLARYSSEPALPTLQEGGEIRPHVLDDMDKEIWGDFQRSFLS